MSRFVATLLLSALALLGTGCDRLGLESASDLAARREADGKAVGGACRHAARAIEDCYTLNRKSDRAAVYSGWREMNEYMRENKVEAVVPVLNSEPLAAAKPPERAEVEVEAAKTTDRSAAKTKKQAS